MAQVELQNDPEIEPEEASRIASRLGLDLESLEGEFFATAYEYLTSESFDRLHRILLACDVNAAVLRSCEEVPLHPEQRARACQEIDGGRSHEPFTKYIFVSQTDHDYNQEALPDSDTLCMFISDGADQHETWTLIREIRVQMVRKDMELEITVTAGKEEIATIVYNTSSMVLSRCLGRVGLALELLFVVRRGIAGSNVLQTCEEGNIWRVESLTWLVGVAVISGLVGSGSKFAIASGASHWMPAELLNRLHKRWPVQNGCFDVRDMGMESNVRAVRSTEVKSLCPACWINPAEPTQEKTVDHTIVRPTHLVGEPDENGGYTAVSYLWSEFGKSITIPKMQKYAAAVGGPATLWVDRACIDQEDDTEKNSEIPLMAAYYAGAHTTLICPASEVVDVPILQPSRHLVAIPERLRAYKGLVRWKRDLWHERVWTFQEGALSKNPKVWVADQDLGLSACWLNFMSWTANHSRPVRCNIGLPPYYKHFGYSDLPWGEIKDHETWEYKNFFARSWNTCERHNWAPNVNNIRSPLSRLIESTQLRKCSEPRDKILGVLGLALSSESFRTDMVSNLQDAYQEAIRSGSLGAEILLYGWTAPGPRSWIPKAHYPNGWLDLGRYAKEIPCNIEQPMVDQNGRLVLRVYEVEEFDIYGDLDANLIDNSGDLRFSNGNKSLVMFSGCVTKSVKKYVLVDAEDKTSAQLWGGILIYASEFEEGKHVLKGACRISTTRGPERSLPHAFNPDDMTYLLLSAD